MYGWSRCYDPCKDIVLPSWRRPEAMGASPYLRSSSGGGGGDGGGGDGGGSGRDLLFYFNGNLGGTSQFENYSFGVRQQLRREYGHLAARAQRFADGGASGGGGVPYGERVIVTDVKTPRYSEIRSRRALYASFSMINCCA